MSVLVNSIEIAAPAEVVFDYASDLSNELEWGEPVRIVKLTDGPVGVGTRFDAQWKGGGPIDVTYVLIERPRRWRTRGRSPRMDIYFEGKVETLAPSRSRLTRTMELHPHGGLKLLSPILKRAMQRTVEKNLGALRVAIERRFAALSDSTVVAPV
ncbi:MAG TPA: SRPBCC family protein [Candidatus Dormibacteraeota bacterium]|nr:SRPBCC family protein [Candidatus Dormibacteraeota bacterium]